MNTIFVMQMKKAFFFKCLPDKTLAFRNEKCHGWENIKQ